MAAGQLIIAEAVAIFPDIHRSGGIYRVVVVGW